MRSVKITDYISMLHDNDRRGDFIRRFRVSLAVFNKLENLVDSFGYTKCGGWDRTVEMLVFLRWMAFGGDFINIADCFDMPRSTVNDIVKRFVQVFAENANKIIYLPDDDELKIIAQEFNDFTTTSNVFSHVAGCLDGSLIKLKKGPKNKKGKDKYYDRKMNHSINMQAIVSSDRRFRYIFVGYPGRAHDSRIFKQSSLYRNAIWPPLPYYILADPGYCNTDKIPVVITPKRAGKDGELSAIERLF